MRHKQFEVGDNPGPLLSLQLRRGGQASRAIHEVKSQTGAITTDPSELNKCFRNFYKNVYRSQNSAAEEDIPWFLRSFYSLK